MLRLLISITPVDTPHATFRIDLKGSCRGWFECNDAAGLTLSCYDSHSHLMIRQRVSYLTVRRMRGISSWYFYVRNDTQVITRGVAWRGGEQ